MLEPRRFVVDDLVDDIRLDALELLLETFNDEIEFVRHLDVRLERYLVVHRLHVDSSKDSWRYPPGRISTVRMGGFVIADDG